MKKRKVFDAPPPSREGWLKTIPEVITASIRTDAIANPHLFRRLLGALEKKAMMGVQIPRQGPRNIDISQALVLSLWSKNYALFIKNYDNPLFTAFPLLLFNFTINGDDSPLENVRVPLDDLMGQLGFLLEHYGHDVVNVRFDPVVFWTENGKEKNNLRDFELICQYLEQFEVTRLSFAFCKPFHNVVKRMSLFGRPLKILSLEQKHEVLRQLMDIAAEHKICLLACCEDNVVGFEHNGKIVGKSECTPAKVVHAKLAAKGLAIRAKTKGNRPECACIEYTDIFGYEACSNGCAYCYANPNTGAIKRLTADIEDIVL